jgi:hypothetical protein
MKYFLFTLSLVFVYNAIFSQQINKHLVVVEISTGTWCQYCPGAAMGADELVENFGDAVAIIENHGGDSYQNTGSSSRISLYATSGFPTAYFDGGNAVVGGDHNVSMYSFYEPEYNLNISELTSFDVSMEITPINDFTFNVILTVDKVYDYTGTNLVAHLVLTESHIPESWQGMTELNFVNRAMFPSPSGTVLDFSSSNQQIINYTVSIDNELVVEECELVAFVQNMSSKEILQGNKAGLNIPIGSNNVMLEDILSPVSSDEICDNVISPIIKVKNRGESELNTFSIEYQINGGNLYTQNWTGTLLYGESTEINLEEIPFEPLDVNNLYVNLINPNELVDDDLTNNTLQTDFNRSVESTPVCYMEINPAGSFSLPWTVKDLSGTVIYEGNASGYNMFNETFELNTDECYEFHLTSMMGNGIPGDGYLKLTDQNGDEVFYFPGNSFTDQVVKPFKTSLEVSSDLLEAGEFKIAPNPADDHVSIFLPDTYKEHMIIISDIIGKRLIQIPPNHQNFRIETGDLKPGIYFVSLVYKNSIISSQKLIINE